VVDEGRGEGPGHRSQVLALTPEQELALGRYAYREILSESEVLPLDDPRVRHVREVGGRIARAARIRPLLREINLHVDQDQLEWEFNVIESDRINAFCLPGGKVAVYTGLFDVVENVDELATVIGHEVAHTLAHHASERIALSGPEVALSALRGGMASLKAEERRRLISLLSAGTTLDSLAYNRFQETEADHIGLFLMTFAGYDPDAALTFWERMSAISTRQGRLPEILSDHPSDERRIAQLKAWIPLVKGAKKAYDQGMVVPEN
jgi:predicted Zn-dependent protease